MKWKTPKSYKDVSLILLENKVLNEFLNNKFIEAMKFWNILVHNYIYLNPTNL
jgi:uncharacterized protein YutE (UPF0331/DUF86 family)